MQPDITVSEHTCRFSCGSRTLEMRMRTVGKKATSHPPADSHHRLQPLTSYRCSLCASVLRDVLRLISKRSVISSNGTGRRFNSALVDLEKEDNDDEEEEEYDIEEEHEEATRENEDEGSSISVDSGSKIDESASKKR